MVAYQLTFSTSPWSVSWAPGATGGCGLAAGHLLRHRSHSAGFIVRFMAPPCVQCAPISPSPSLSSSSSHLGRGRLLAFEQ